MKKNRNHQKVLLSGVLLGLLFSSIPGAQAAWNPDPSDGSSLNRTATQGANQASFVIATNGTPYIAWSENDSTANQIYVDHWTGSAWVRDGNGTSLNRNAAQNAFSPSLAIHPSTGIPYVAWTENNASGVSLVYVSHLSGTSWATDGGALNRSNTTTASFAGLAFNPQNNVPYVVWEEGLSYGRYIFVSHLSAGNWLPDGGWVNRDVHGANYSSLAITANGVPYVAWNELNGSAVPQTYVSHLNAGTWVPNGGSLNRDPASQANALPRITIAPGGAPYVMWDEENISGATYSYYVSHWNGGAWIPDGGNLKRNAAASYQDGAWNGIAVAPNGTPYAIWTEGAAVPYQVYVSHWNGSAWLPNGDGLNRLVNTRTAMFPSIAIAPNGTPFAAWQEQTLTSAWQLLVSQWQDPPTATPTSTVTPTVTSTPSRTPTFTQTPVLTPTPTQTIKPTPAVSPYQTVTLTATSTSTQVPAPQYFFKIFHNQINPGQGEQARIRWCRPNNAAVTLQIYNLLGDKITTLVENQPSTKDAVQEVTWDGKTSTGAMAGSGIYIVYLKSGDYQDHAKIAVIK